MIKDVGAFMGWEQEKVFGGVHWFIRDGWLPIKVSACGAWVKGKSEPAMYPGLEFVFDCVRCIDVLFSEEVKES